jgi:hypothetical protein
VTPEESDRGGFKCGFQAGVNWEREACANLLDEMGDEGHDYRSIMYAIRARGEK